MTAINSMPDWFHTRPVDDGYFIRFKYVFGDNDQDKNAFIELWPNPLKNVAEEIWPIMCNVYPDLYLNANTVQKAKGLIAKEAWKWQGQYKRISEVNNLKLREFFSQDIITTRDRDASSHSNSNVKGNTTGTSSSDSTDFSVNNDVNVDPETNEVQGWDSNRLADGANVNKNTNTNDTTNDTKTDSTNHLSDRSERTNTQYDANAIMKLMRLSTDPNVYYFGKFITGISASMQTNTEKLHDWKGNL